MSLPGTDSQDRLAPARVTEDERNRGSPHPVGEQALCAIFPRPVRAGRYHPNQSASEPAHVRQAPRRRARGSSFIHRPGFGKTIWMMMAGNSYLMIFAMAMTGC